MIILKIYRMCLLVPASLFFLVAGAFINLFLAGSKSARIRANALSTLMWARAMCNIIGIRVSKRGGSAGKGSFIVCNHLSYLDIFVMGTLQPSSFLSKQEVRGWPLVGWLAYLGGTVFVNRESKKAALDAMKEIEGKIDSGVSVIIFPEGTTSDGRSIKAFKSTFFKVPAGRGIPVMPVSIRYSDEIMDKVAWYGGMDLAPHFWKIIGLRRIDAELRFGQPVLEPSDSISEAAARKSLCSKAYECVVEGFNACGTMER